MNSNFYLELGQMVEDAITQLNSLGTNGNVQVIFDAIRSVGTACLDGDKLQSSLREDLGPKRVHAFQSAVFTLVRLSTLAHGANANSGTSSALHRVKIDTTQLLQEAQAREIVSKETASESIPMARNAFVNPLRIDALKALPKGELDPKRLIRLLEELNHAHASESHMATAMLVRAITDHIPPVFSFKNFTEFANNYSGYKSFKEQMLQLQNSLRHVANGYLHNPIRSSEDLPTGQQVDFRSPLDSLLSEVIRVLQTRS
jgi:hypothetical protein